MSSISQAPDNPLVVIVDDDQDMVALISRFLDQAGYAVEAFNDAEACLAAFGRLMPEAVCLDLLLPGLGGIETLTRIKQVEPHLPVVILTADNTADSAVRAMQEGAYDYLVKPIDRTKLVTTIKNAVDRARMSLRLVQLEREVEGRGYPGIVGRTPRMRELFRQMDRLAASDVSVLIHGESGTGKELVAKAIHLQSGRRRGAFVALNCAAIPDTLQESELFGHERGAFTGALERRIGRFEQANKGTLFLDEVAELSPGLQAKLLRALQERTFQRVGGSVDIRSDFRLVAATHRDLSEEVAAGRFRQDLFFRIAVFELEVPALRHRRDDIPVLASTLLQEVAVGRSVDIAPEALERLMDYDWPGNVRELSNAMQRAWVASSGSRISLHDLPDRISSGTRAGSTAGTGSGAGSLDQTPIPPVGKLEEMERIAIQQAMARHAGNLSEAGRQLGIGRSTLYRKLKQYGLR